MAPRRRQDGGIVLAGGGALGAYEVGVLEALFSGRWQQGRGDPVVASVYTGTSVGAYNAAFLVSQGPDDDLGAVRRLRQIWVERIAASRGRRRNGVFRFRGDLSRGFWPRPEKPSELLEDLLEDLGALARNSTRRAFDLASSREPLMRRIARLFDSGDFVSSSPLDRLIRDTIAAETVLDPRSQTLKMVTTEWDRGETMVFHNREDPARYSPLQLFSKKSLEPATLNPALRASVAIPGLLSPVRVGDGVFVDGGVRMNMPLLPVIEEGVPLLHVIYFNPALETLPYGRSPSTFEALERLWAASPTTQADLSFGLVQLLPFLADAVARVEEGAPPPVPQGPELTQTPNPASWETATEGNPVHRFVRRHASNPPLVVHRHFPSRPIGGAFRMLDFDVENIRGLIELGFADAVHHDCQANGCMV